MNVWLRPFTEAHVITSRITSSFIKFVYKEKNNQTLRHVFPDVSPCPIASLYSPSTRSSVVSRSGFVFERRALIGCESEEEPV